jgi:hypothetical protein
VHRHPALPLIVNACIDDDDVLQSFLEPGLTHKTIAKTSHAWRNLYLKIAEKSRTGISHGSGKD